MRFSLIALAGFAAALAYAPQAQAEDITLVADEWCPYNCAPGADKPGMAIEIAKAIFEPQGAVIAYRLVPWSRALEQVATGAMDGAVGASRQERADLAFPANDLGPLTNVIVTAKASGFAYAGIDSLKGRKLGLIQDYGYGEPIDSFMAANPGDIRAITGNDVTGQLLKLLLAGRVDAIVEGEAVIRYAAGAAGVRDQLALTPLRTDTDPDGNVNIGFSPNERGRALAQRFSDGLAALRANGELAKILARYDLEDWAPAGS